MMIASFALLLAGVPQLRAQSHPNWPPTTGPSVDVLDRVEISREPHAFSAWPVLQKLANGNLVVIYTQHTEYPEKVHAAPTAWPMASHSADSGKTWDKNPAVVGDWQTAGIDCCDLSVLDDGSLLAHVNQMKWPSHGWNTKGRLFTDASYKALLQFRSTDGGASWQPFGQVDLGKHEGLFLIRPAIQFKNELLIACADEWQRPPGCVLLRSSDHGKTWGNESVIARKSGWFFTEPSILALANGKLLCVMRTWKGDFPKNGGYTNLHQCESADGGKTWSEPKDMGHYGYPAHLLRLTDGRILCLYGHRIEPLSIRLLVSSDEAHTWSGPRTIANLASADLGYPTAVQLQDGSIYSVFYAYDGRPNWEPAGGVCGIWGVRFRL